MTRQFAHLSTIVFFGTCLLATAVAAEMKECDGVWTNRPCEGSTTRTIEKAPAKEPPGASEKLADQKRLILQDLVKASYDAREKYNVFFSHRTVEQQCAEESVSLDYCQTLVHDAQNRLMDLVKLAAHETKRERPSVTNNNYTTSITIVQPEDEDYVSVPGHRLGNGQHKPGPFQGYRTRFK